MKFLLFFLIAMKKFFLFLLLAPLFISFTSAYNCSTATTRLSNLLDKFQDFNYRYKITAAKWERISNEYEYTLWLQEVYRMDAERDSLEAEREVLYEEVDRCDSQRSKITQYLKAWDGAFSELQNASSYKDYNIKTINKAIQNYQDAYDTMREATWLWDKSLESQLKERISKLKEFKSLIETTDEIINLTEKADSYFDKGDYDKALKYYKDALSYRWKIDDDSMFKAIESKIDRVDNIKAYNKQQETIQKQQAEDDFTRAKEYFDKQGKTAILDSIIVAVKKKETRIQNNVYKAAEAFTKSSDTYTRNIGIYLVHERDK